MPCTFVEEVEALGHERFGVDETTWREGGREEGEK